MTESPRRSRARATGTGSATRVVAPTVLALFLLSGTLKDTPVLSALPLDLTVLTAAALGLVVVHRLLEPGVRVPAALVVVLALWLTFVPGVLAGAGSPYAGEKVTALATLTLLAAVAALVVLRDERDIAAFAVALVVLGVAVAAVTFAFPDARELASQKIAAEGATTINVARALGAAALIALLAASEGRVGRWLGGGGAMFFLAAMVLTGSRGPVVAVVLAAAVVFVVRPSRVDRAVRALTYVVAVAVAAAVAFVVSADQFAVQRALAVVGGSGEQSTEVRTRLMSAAAQLSLRHPFGVGWGRLGEVLPASARADASAAQYPHNIVLEILVESGWVAGIVFVVLAALAVDALLRRTGSFAGAAMAALLVFHLVNAMVSGTVNDNRALFALIAVGLAARCGDLVLGGRGTPDPDPHLAPLGADEQRSSGGT